MDIQKLPFLRELLAGVAPSFLVNLEEIRIRQGRPTQLIANAQSRWLGAQGELLIEPVHAIQVEDAFCRRLLDQLTGHSVYSYEEQLRRGYITVEGGHRIGLCGQVTLQEGRVKLIRDVTGFNIRLARERKGVAKRLLPYLFDHRHHVFHHTLLVSPPQHGKTTVLRDLVRFAANGFTLTDATSVDGQKVAVVDERSEIAACLRGVPQLDVGWRTDVLDQCPKAEGMMMMIRAMSPQVMAVDEVGGSADVESLQEALLAGIKIFATVHGHHVHDLSQKPMLRALYEAKQFERYVLIQRKEGTHLLMKVYDAHGVCLTTVLEPLG